MFTGLVSAMGVVRDIEASGGKTRFTIEAAYPLALIAMGASIAHAGVCLTVVEAGAGRQGEDESAWWIVEAVPETLARTTLGRLKIGDPLNLELSLRLGEELGGHLVYGHVDGLGEILSVAAEGDSFRVRIGLPAPLARFVAMKGSIAVDGVSLTVASVGNDSEAHWFEVAVIPHTFAVTTLGNAGAGDRVNLEVDMLARYVARIMEIGGQ